MRYKLSENTYILGRFPSGSTVTITLYDLSDNSIVSLSSNACQEVGTTGIFKWSTANIASQPTTRKEYLWVMSDGTVSSLGKIVLGGYPDDILSSSQVSNAVWDEQLSSHTSAGTFGKKLGELTSGSSASEIADAVWDEPVSNHQTSGTFGKIISFIKNLILSQ